MLHSLRSFVRSIPRGVLPWLLQVQREPMPFCSQCLFSLPLSRRLGNEPTMISSLCFPVMSFSSKRLLPFFLWKRPHVAKMVFINACSRSLILASSFLLPVSLFLAQCMVTAALHGEMPICSFHLLQAAQTIALWGVKEQVNSMITDITKTNKRRNKPDCCSGALQIQMAPYPLSP